jgi:hypothetical protein
MGSLSSIRLSTTIHVDPPFPPQQGIYILIWASTLPMGLENIPTDHPPLYFWHYYLLKNMCINVIHLHSLPLDLAPPRSTKLGAKW